MFGLRMIGMTTIKRSDGGGGLNVCNDTTKDPRAPRVSLVARLKTWGCKSTVKILVLDLAKGYRRGYMSIVVDKYRE